VGGKVVEFKAPAKNREVELREELKAKAGKAIPFSEYLQIANRYCCHLM
jgi:hypothetical protein